VSADDNTLRNKFVQWMGQHKVQFKTVEEFAQRFAIFTANDRIIEEHNESGATYAMAHNAFSHLTFDEFSAMMGFGRGMPAEWHARLSSGKVHEVSAAPDSYDWTPLGAVTAVKNQGSCGSCWAFSTTGGLEGAYYLKTGDLTSFSEQQLVDCDTNDAGCNGGLMDNAFSWIQSNGGLCTESDYPYVSSSGASQSCKTSCSKVSGSSVAEWTDVPNSEDGLKSAVALQPVSVAIQANQLAFQFYSSGVLTGRCGSNLDHGVLAVGYGTYTDGTPYWKVKNSWGETWGMDGYILIERGTTQAGDKCGITSAASYPTL